MFNTLFKNKKPIIGMIHLPPLPGYEKHPGMDAAIKKAVEDLYTLQKADFDGVLVENDNDQPHQIEVSKTIITSFIQVMKEICKESKIPVGMEIIYDMIATIEVAQKVKADFVRLDVFVDNIQTKWGKIGAQAKKIMKLKKDIGKEKLVLLTDIQVKHAKMLDQKSLGQSAKEAIKRGSDALIVTGDWTGQSPNIADCQSVKKAVKDFPVLIGSGFDQHNAKRLLKYADGAIVGTSIKSGDYIDFSKAKQLITKMKKIRSSL